MNAKTSSAAWSKWHRKEAVALELLESQTNRMQEYLDELVRDFVLHAVGIPSARLMEMLGRI